MNIMHHIRRTGLAIAAGGTLALGLSLGTAAPVVAPAAAQTNAADLDRAVTALRGISTMRASFTQTDRAQNRVNGTMTLKRPGKIRFDYGSDADLLVVSNGRSLYMIDYEVNQVQRWPIRNSPLGALLDPNRDVKQFGRLLSLGNRPEFGRIILNFARDASAPGGLQLMNWVAVDAQNHRTTVQLANHRYGLSVPDSTFRFRDPRRSSRRPG